MSALTAALAEIESRLTGITVAGGYQTNLGLNVLPAGTSVDESDAPCVVLYEAAPDDSGFLPIVAAEVTACGIEMVVPYVVQAFVRRDEDSTPLAEYDKAATDIMKALYSTNRGAMTGAKAHRFVRRQRGLVAKGGSVIPVLVHGSFTVTEQVFA